MIICSLDVKSDFPCPVLTVAFWPVYRFLRRQVRWSGIPVSWRISHSLLWSIQSKALVNEEVSVFLKFLCFFHDPADVGNLISGSSVFSKSRLYIWKFSVHIMLKPSLNNFKLYLVSIWLECNCAGVWTFFGMALLWKLTFSSPVATTEFSNLLTYWVQHFNSIIF